MRVPAKAGIGKAKLTLSFSDWKEGRVAPATYEIPIVDTPPEGTITVEGEGLTSEAKEAWAALAKHLLSEAITRAVESGWKEITNKLRLADDIETTLIRHVGTIEGTEGKETLSVYLVRPGKVVEKPHLVELKLEDQRFLRFLRTVGPVERPIAIVTMTRMVGGQPSLTDVVLTYDADGKWKQQVPSKRIEQLDFDKP